MATTSEIIARARAAHAARLVARAQAQPAQPAPAPLTPILTKIAQVTLKSTSDGGMEFNEQQSDAIERGLRGHSFCLIGAAGTGKTTVTQELIRLLQQASHVSPFTASTKVLVKDTPSILICGYTNKAVNNIRKRLPPAMQKHCSTIHSVLEYGPVFFDTVDADGYGKVGMRFEPARNAANLLPPISTIIFEESSMIGTDLYGQLLAALPNPHSVQLIFLGDIFQLPPVFGHSILGFKLAELPVVELTHVYRQALLSPIISLATAIRTDTIPAWLREQDRKNLVDPLQVDAGEHGKLTIHPWKKRIAPATALKTLITKTISLIKAGAYDPDQDQILCPFNKTGKAFGTIGLNQGIAEYLTTERGALTHEVIARFTRSYWAVGDRVLVDRHEGVITDIIPAVGYLGHPTKKASITLNRSGIDSVLDNETVTARSAEDILNELDKLAELDKDSDGTNLASHTIKVWVPDLQSTQTLTTAGEINALILSYALTVHKSQGSEWRKVFIYLHHTHQTMVSRELLYTAVTRAREELYIICEGDIAPYKNQVLLGSNRATIPGTKLQDKIEYFQLKKAAMQSVTE